MSSSSSALSRSYASWDSQVPSRSVVDTMGSPPDGWEVGNYQATKAGVTPALLNEQLYSAATEHVHGIRLGARRQRGAHQYRAGPGDVYLGVPDLGAGAVLGLYPTQRRAGVALADGERHRDRRVGYLLDAGDARLVR